jgi:hypothetical protein
MGPAVRGALAHLRAHLAANPGHRVALVLATDGLPDGFCSRNNPDNIVEAVAGGRTQGIPTYVIGVFSAAQLMMARRLLDPLAMAGGTDAPHVLTAAGDLTMKFREALAAIRGTALPCEFTIPPPTMGAIDFGKVNVQIKTAAAAEDVPYVASRDRCDPTRGGWYYDVDPATGGTPKTILVCEATCRRFKADATTRVQIGFGCKTRVIL